MKVLKSPCLNCDNNQDRSVCSCTCERLKKYRQEQYFEKEILLSEELSEQLPYFYSRPWKMSWELVWGSPYISHFPQVHEDLYFF